MTNMLLAVTYFAILLGLGILIANILRKRNVPDVLFLLLLGLLLGPTIYANPAISQYVNITLVDVNQMGDIPEFIRTLSLILIVFMGTFSINAKIFKKYSSISLELSVLGPVINTIILGLAAKAIFGFDWLLAFILGAILSGTGEAVVYSFRNTLSNHKTPLTILILESVFNSPVAVLLPLLFVGMLGIQGTFEPLRYVSQFWRLVVAGIGTGIIFGYGIARVFRSMLKQYTSLLLFAIALIIFALAELVGGSGVLAVAVAGLIMGNTVFKEHDDVVWFGDYLSEMFRISLFTLFGAMASLFLTWQEFQMVLIFFVMVLLARIIFLMPAIHGKKFSHTDVAVMTFAAPKGVEVTVTGPIIAGALIALNQPALGAQIINISFLILFLTVMFSSVVALAVGSKGPKKKTELRLSKSSEYVEKSTDIQKVFKKLEKPQKKK